MAIYIRVPSSASAMACHTTRLHPLDFFVGEARARIRQWTALKRATL